MSLLKCCFLFFIFIICFLTKHKSFHKFLFFACAVFFANISRFFNFICSVGQTFFVVLMFTRMLNVFFLNVTLFSFF